MRSLLTKKLQNELDFHGHFCYFKQRTESKKQMEILSQENIKTSIAFAQPMWCWWVHQYSNLKYKVSSWGSCILWSSSWQSITGYIVNENLFCVSISGLKALRKSFSLIEPSQCSLKQKVTHCYEFSSFLLLKTLTPLKSLLKISFFLYIKVKRLIPKGLILWGAGLSQLSLTSKLNIWFTWKPL